MFRVVVVGIPGMRSGTQMTRHRRDEVEETGPRCEPPSELSEGTMLLMVAPRYEVVGCPSDQLALSNCLIVHPNDFPDGQPVLVKRAFGITVK